MVVVQRKGGAVLTFAPPPNPAARSRLIIGDFGPSDSALAASSGWRLRRPAADRHAARCASRDLCSGGAPRRYPPPPGSPRKGVNSQPIFISVKTSHFSEELVTAAHSQTLIFASQLATIPPVVRPFSCGREYPYLLLSFSCAIIW